MSRFAADGIRTPFLAMNYIIRIIATMPPEVQTALRVLVEWQADQNK
jgi:hypothetical protein